MVRVRQDITKNQSEKNNLAFKAKLLRREQLRFIYNQFALKRYKVAGGHSN